MNTKQLETVMQMDRVTQTKFRGVFASDQLPDLVDIYPSAYIANVDPSDQPGSHWVAMYFTEEGKAEFWDSYGQTPNLYSRTFKNFLERNSNYWIMNHTVLQSLDSSVCGEYCIYYLIHRCRGFSMSTIVNHFSQRKRINDSIVYEFAKRHYPSVFISRRKRVTEKHQTSQSHIKNI